MTRWHPIALALATTVGLCGCGTSSPPPATTAGRVARSSPSHTRRTRARRHRARHAKHIRRPGALRLSGASATIVQPQPPPGSCHARGSGRYWRPDPTCTPGALSPAVTQATIGRTICVSGYSESVRPAESVTEQEKLASMSAYGDAGPPSDYEYDHLVSLELGGAANDRRNLWPEPGASPNPKDAVENALHRLVCDGAMRLATAQRIIAGNWVAWALRQGSTPGGAKSGSAVGAASPSAGAAPPSSGPDKPLSEVNCSDFSTHAAAQQWFEQHGGSASNDVAGLDGDHDGLACESLP